MKCKAMWAVGVAILFIGAFSSQASAANKPLKGKYTCKGTASQSILVGNVGGGTKSSAVKARLQASRGNFLFYTTDKAWPAIIEGYINPDSQTIVLSTANKAHKLMTVKDCAVMYMDQNGSGSQNKNGRKVSFSIEQSYSCGFSGSKRVDKYDLTCKR